MRRLISAPSRPDTLSATTHGLGSLVSPCMNEIVASYSRTARNGPKLSKHSRLAFVFIKNRKTSAVSTTDWMVETQLCKLRGTSETFVGRACSIFHFLYKKLKNVSCEYNGLNGWNSTLQAAWYIRRVRIIWFLWTKPTIWLSIPWYSVLHKISSARVLCFILMKDIQYRSVTPLDAARVNRTIFHNHFVGNVSTK